MAARSHPGLDFILEYAPKLRALGVTSVSVENCAFTLGEVPVAPSDNDDDEPDESDHLSPLDDPSTFGRSKGVPSLGGKS